MRGRGQSADHGVTLRQNGVQPERASQDILQLVRTRAERSFRESMQVWQKEQEMVSRREQRPEPTYTDHVLAETNPFLVQSFETGDWDLTRSLIRAYTRSESSDDDLPLLEMDEYEFATGMEAYKRIGDGHHVIPTLNWWARSKSYLPSRRDLDDLQREHFDLSLHNGRQGFHGMVLLREALTLAALQRGDLQGNDSPGWNPPTGRMIRVERQASVPAVHLGELKEKDLIYVRKGFLQTTLPATIVPQGYLHIHQDKVQDVFYGPYRRPISHPSLHEKSLLRTNQALRLLDPLTVVETIDRKL